MIRVLVADDHSMFVRAITTLLTSEPDIEVVATVGTGDDAVRAALEHHPDVVLMDLHMPGINGIEATRTLAEAAPHVRVLVLTMFDDDEWVAAALRVGARGYLLKGAREADVARAIRAVHAGDLIIGEPLARKVGALLTDPPAVVPRAFPTLTDRELEVLDQLARGLDNRAIAARFSSARRLSATTSRASSASSRSTAAPRPWCAPERQGWAVQRSRERSDRGGVARVARQIATETRRERGGKSTEFPSAAASLDAAIGMQQAIDRSNRTAAGPDLQVRIGISTGDCVADDGDYFGRTVVEAARLCAASAASSSSPGTPARARLAVATQLRARGHDVVAVKERRSDALILIVAHPRDEESIARAGPRAQWVGPPSAQPVANSSLPSSVVPPRS